MPAPRLLDANIDYTGEDYAIELESEGGVFSFRTDERTAVALVAAFSAVLSGDPHEYVKRGDFGDEHFPPIGQLTGGAPGVDADYSHYDADEALERGYALILAAADEMGLPFSVEGEE